MRNITLSADEDLIESARRKAESEKTTLNNLFRGWLSSYTKTASLDVDEVRRIVSQAGKFREGRRLTREEWHER